MFCEAGHEKSQTTMRNEFIILDKVSRGRFHFVALAKEQGKKNMKKKLAREGEIYQHECLLDKLYLEKEQEPEYELMASQ